MTKPLNEPDAANPAFGSGVVGTKMQQANQPNQKPSSWAFSMSLALGERLALRLFSVGSNWRGYAERDDAEEASISA